MNAFTVVGIILVVLGAIGTGLIIYGQMIDTKKDKQEIISKIDEKGASNTHVEIISGDKIQGDKKSENKKEENIIAPNAYIVTKNQRGDNTVQINQVSSQSYQALSSKLKNQVDNNLSEFRAKYSSVPRIAIEIETGNSLRHKVATDLEEFLLRHRLGNYPKGNTFMGRFPDYPITVFFNAEDKSIAEDLIRAINPYIKQGIHLESNNSFPKDFIRIYLNGVPAFSSDGSVSFE